MWASEYSAAGLLGVTYLSDHLGSVCLSMSVSVSLSIRSHHAAQSSLTLPDSGQVLRLQVYATTPGTEGFYRHDS